MMSNENEGNICNKHDDVAATHVKHDDESFNVFPDLGGEARRGEARRGEARSLLLLLTSIYQGQQAFHAGGVDPKAVD